ncbi:regulatory iron-sulfur-containing complex subunit RicT [uncultured Capnocytophaga sp.]|uniref:regulatory iron-sulfur-containing complex subunit RicT n=1 Tax=uncultured Capnocytophaga sp. TaxID=159273 RepID=UPI0028E6350C|nr:regulatory iron-sulfur-containing complex subunit RicT [uncultured Capnocytophaga sp.]
MTHNKRPIYNYGSVKLSVYDWLSGIPLPSHKEPFDCVEVHFKNSRKEFFRNSYKLPLQIGDVVATETTSGHDIGTVSLTGELVRIQMQKKKADPLSPTLPKIYRKANEHDIEIWQEYRSKEVFLQKRSRELAIALGLEMKISDVEFQGDGSKATFYYTAEGRVDFRQLIKDMAKEFGTRIEMRQIGYRQEAARLGGIGSSGREISCSTWLTDFKSVTTAAARYQQLSLNPQKLAGQCGKLKCDLNFELDCYLEALRDFPKTDTKLQTEKGIATCQKVDIFKRLMWFTYEGDFLNWHKLTVDQVKEILQLTREKKIISSIEEYLQAQEVPSIPSRNIDSESQEGSLTRFDEKPRSRNRKNQKTKNASQNKENNPKPKENTPNKEAIEKPQKSKESNNTIPKEAPKEKEEAKNLVQGQTKRNSNKRRNKKTANPRPTPAQNNE